MDNQAVTNDFGYNVRSEVISAMMSSNQFGYAYDPIGNRQTATNNAESLCYVANELNQYTSITDGVTLEPSYDDDGNMLTFGAWTFTWNGENRLVAAQQGKQCQVAFAYDYMGRMFAKATYDAADLETPVSVLRHIWDGFNIVRSATMSNDVVIVAEYNVWGLDLSQTMQGAGGVGGLLAVTVAGGDDPGHYIAAYDANGNVTEYVDATGAIVAHREYGPFGETTALSGPMQNAFTHWWSTKPWDPVTGLSEYQFRMYSPELGRWLNRDPISETGGLNIYSHVNNAGLVTIDILGLNPWLAIAKNCAMESLKKILGNKLKRTMKAANMCGDIADHIVSNGGGSANESASFPLDTPPLEIDNNNWAQVALGCLFRVAKQESGLNEWLINLDDESQKRVLETLMEAGEDEVNDYFKDKEITADYSISYECVSKMKLIFALTATVTVGGITMPFEMREDEKLWQCPSSMRCSSRNAVLCLCEDYKDGEEISAK